MTFGIRVLGETPLWNKEFGANSTYILICIIIYIYIETVIILYNSIWGAKVCEVSRPRAPGKKQT